MQPLVRVMVSLSISWSMLSLVLVSVSCLVCSIPHLCLGCFKAFVVSPILVLHCASLSSIMVCPLPALHLFLFHALLGLSLWLAPTLRGSLHVWFSAICLCILWLCHGGFAPWLACFLPCRFALCLVHAVLDWCRVWFDLFSPLASSEYPPSFHSPPSCHLFLFSPTPSTVHPRTAIKKELNSLKCLLEGGKTMPFFRNNSVDKRRMRTRKN